MSGLLPVLLSGFSIGLIGSFHCIGMCGPLALSLPIHQLSAFRKLAAISLYNIGRACTYAGIGLAFGLLGEGFSVFEIQQALSISAGIFILVILYFHQFGNAKTGMWQQWTHFIQVRLGAFLKSEKTLPTYFAIGLLNGALPCGLVYVAVAAAAASGSVLNSPVLMFAFGMGTVPMMVTTMVFGKFMTPKLGRKFNRLIPRFTAVVALLLILRGLNLGIPLVSPVHHAPATGDPNPPAVVHCH